jgi:hypothetical protein
VAYAKERITMGKTRFEASPRIEEKAQLTSDIGVEKRETSGTDNKITKPVIIQSSVLSKTTSHMAKSPATCGVLPFDLECAIAEVPTPASLESIPRANPSRTAKNDIPPPRALLKLNAEDIISFITSPNREMFLKITIKHIIM